MLERSVFMSSKSILIVEDDVAIRETLELVLKEETAYQALLAPDAETALTLLPIAAPDLFLLDYRLPGMNGIGLIDRIREIKAFEHTPIILMSAGHFWTREPRDVRYLAKPFELDQFLRVVEECLNGA